ncbi:hypothetical protein GIB67_035239 [Kingdonia uniflora]|uniref:AMP-dependent synthetase/ligase domain-containing protein n=1 Tax=Kingdonia uniflora TaxID=39325 RepID=A0A7J7KXV2_9MAGN|nr:hypothetical protein GIB67_035239 [Kingdonia uniflora]
MEVSERGRGHICQCLSRIATIRRTSTVTICGDVKKTGFQFVESVESLANGLSQLGLTTGDVVAIAALNRSISFFPALPNVG